MRKMTRGARAPLFNILLTLGMLLSGLVAAQEYFVGDSVKVDLSRFGQYTAEIHTPQGKYLQRSDSPLLFLEFSRSGNYTVNVRSETATEYFIYEVFEAKEVPSLEPVYYDLDGIEYNSVTPLQQKLFESEPTRPQIKVGEEVTWTRRQQIDSRRDVELEIPRQAEQVLVKEEGKEVIHVEKKRFEFFVSSFFGEEDNKTIGVEAVQGELELSYTTPAPTKKERLLGEGKKEVAVSSEMHYTNVLSIQLLMSLLILRILLF